METKLTSKLGIRPDFRDFVTGIPTFDVPQTSSGPGGIFFSVDGVLHNIEAGVGIVFFLWPK